MAIQETIEGSDDNKYKMKFDHVETKNLSGLTIRKDLTLWVLIVGGAIFMIGVIQGCTGTIEGSGSERWTGMCSSPDIRTKLVRAEAGLEGRARGYGDIRTGRSKRTVKGKNKRPA